MAITLNSKVYNYAGFDPNAVSSYKETATGIPTAASDLTNRVSYGTGTVVRVKWQLVVPIVAAEDSECVCTGAVLRTDRVSIEYIFGSASPKTERQDVRARVASLIADAQYIASIDDLVQSTG